MNVPLTEPQKAGIASFCPYNIGPGKCFPSTFYKRINAGDRKGACEAIRWWIKDGGRGSYPLELIATVRYPGEIRKVRWRAGVSTDKQNILLKNGVCSRGRITRNPAN